MVLYVELINSSSTICQVTSPPPISNRPEWFRLLLHLCCVWHTSYNALSMRMTQQFSRFCPWWPWPLTLTFKLVRARDQKRLPCKFGANLLSSSRDMNDKQTKKNKTYHRQCKKNRTLLVCGNKCNYRKIKSHFLYKKINGIWLGLLEL